MPIFTIPIHEHGDPSRKGPYPHTGGRRTDSADFRTWFGDSVVTDKSGRPLKVYHATNTDFTEFRAGSHFGSAQAANDRFEKLHDFSVRVVGRDPGRFRVQPVYLKIENPLRLPDLAGLPDPNIAPEDKEGELQQYMRSWESETDLAEVLYERDILTEDEFWEHQYDRLDKLIPLLQSKGYDGIVYKNEIEDPGHDSWIIFDPKQVRSVVG